RGGAALPRDAIRRRGPVSAGTFLVGPRAGGRGRRLSRTSEGASGKRRLVRTGTERAVGRLLDQARRRRPGEVDLCRLGQENAGGQRANRWCQVRENTVGGRPRRLADAVRARVFAIASGRRRLDCVSRRRRTESFRLGRGSISRSPLVASGL